MHEFGIAKTLAESVLEEASRQKALNVSEVIVEVGELSFIGTDQLKFAYNIIAKNDAIIANSKLVINNVSAEVTCKACGYVGPLKKIEEPETHFITPIFACPDCEGRVEISKGRECTIKNIRMTVDD
jgi:hydrogenase nickel incorporation protein HypA/HybF